MPTKPRKRAAKAIRLTFAFDADGIRLIDRTKVQKRPPESASAGEAMRAGLTAELRSGARATHRQTLPEGLPRDVEVFDPKLTRGVYRSPTPPRAGAFSIIVPDDGEADDVVLLSAPEAARGPQAAGPEAPGGPESARPRSRSLDRPVEIARFKLRG